MTNIPPILARRLTAIQWPALLLGLVAAGACIWGAVAYPNDFYHAYLYAYLYWLGGTLGALAMVMIFHTTGGLWGRLVGRLAEAAALNLPLMTVLFIPIALGLRHLYPWANPVHLAAHPEYLHRQAYLNPTFFGLRAALYFVLWNALTLTLNQRSLRQSQHDPHSNDLQALSGGGLLLYAVTMTFASVDWIMSRDPSFFSTIFGFIVMVGQALSGLALLVLFLPLVADQPPLYRLAQPQVYIDLGNLLLVQVILWAYMSFVQFLVIWMGNLQADIMWYTQREQGQRPHAWMWIGAALIGLHFLVPFFLLLFRALKRRPRFLAALALGLLLIHLLDVFWLVVPTGPQRGPQWHFTWLYIATPVAIGGFWLAAFLALAKRRVLIPIVDPHGEPAVEVLHD